MAQKRRTEYTKKFQTGEYHQLYSYGQPQYDNNGQPYPDYDKPKYNYVNRTHIEHLLTCEYCKTGYWAKKENSKYCSANCRNIAMRVRKRTMQLINA